APVGRQPLAARRRLLDERSVRNALPGLADEPGTEDVGRRVVALADQPARVDDDDSGRERIEQQLEPPCETARVALFPVMGPSRLLELRRERGAPPLERPIRLLELPREPVEREEGLLEPALVDVCGGRHVVHLFRQAKQVPCLARKALRRRVFLGSGTSRASNL